MIILEKQFEDKLKTIIKEKDKYKKNLENYQFDSENMKKLA